MKGELTALVFVGESWEHFDYHDHSSGGERRATHVWKGSLSSSLQSSQGFLNLARSTHGLMNELSDSYTKSNSAAVKESSHWDLGTVLVAGTCEEAFLGYLFLEGPSLVL